MANTDDIFTAAKKFQFDDVIIIGVNDEGDLTTMHTLDDLTTISLLQAAAGQINRDLMEELLGRLRKFAN